MLIDSIFCFWKVNRFFHLEISMNCSKPAVNIAENSPYNTNSKWMKHFFIHRSEWACKWNGIPRVTNLMEPINPFPFSMLFKSNQIQLFLTRPWKGVYTATMHPLHQCQSIIWNAARKNYCKREHFETIGISLQ